MLHRPPPDAAQQLAGAERLAEALRHVDGVHVTVEPARRGQSMPHVAAYLRGADFDRTYAALHATWGGDWPYGPVRVSIEPGDPPN